MPTDRNILFLFTDQQRADTMACYGNDRINTPNLNALAHESFVFENAYVSQPICTPSRSSIMTGLYPHATGCIRNNIPLAPAIPTIAGMVPSEYVTAYFGKWHLGNEVIRQHGFDIWLSIEDQYRQYYGEPEYLSTFSDYHEFLLGHGYSPDAESEGARVFSRPFAASLPEEFTKATFLAHGAADFFDRHRDRPFALYINFLEPHPPYRGPFDDMYDPADISFGPAFMKAPPESSSELHRSRATELPRELRTENDWRRLKARYWGNVTLVDNAVGTILSALSDAGLADNTVVAFSSEHGDQLGEHNIIQKSVLYEESVKVPMLLRVPWLSRTGSVVSGRFSHVDLVPTLLDLVDAPLPGHLQGVSRVPVLRGEESLAENDVIVEWNGRNLEPHPGGAEIDRAQNTRHRSIISQEGWKLNLSAGDRCELYNLNEDPGELDNLIDDPSRRGLVRDLTDRVRLWQERVGDDASLPAI